MSDTPRTEIQISSGYRFTEETGVREYVPANFARELERELSREKGQWQLEANSANRYKAENVKLHEAIRDLVIGDHMNTGFEYLIRQCDVHGAHALKARLIALKELV